MQPRRSRFPDVEEGRSKGYPAPYITAVWPALDVHREAVHLLATLDDTGIDAPELRRAAEEARAAALAILEGAAPRFMHSER